MDYVVKRPNGMYSFRIVIPPKQRPKFGGKREIWSSLRTRDKKTARERAVPLIIKWTKLLHPEEISDDTPLTYAHLKEFAASLGFEYRTTDEIQAAMSVRERIEMTIPGLLVASEIKKPNRLEVAAIGGVVVSSLTINEALKRCKAISEDKTLGKNAVEEKKYWDRYANGIADFVAEMGDMDILKITNADANEYKNRLVKRIKAGKLKVDTARKKIMAPRVVLDTVFLNDFPSRALDNPFNSLKPIKSIGDERKRPPVTESEVKAINAKKLTSSANEELKAILTIAELSGAGCKELCLITASDIHLDAPIPHISIRPNEHRRQVKSGGKRHRDIPLLPRAVEAMRAFPNGFPKYCKPNGHTNLSADINNFMEPLVAPGTTFNGFRHRIANLFKKEMEINDTIKDETMGHSLPGMRGKYGTDVPLEVKYEALKRVLLPDGKDIGLPDDPSPNINL
ncbi:hypothetical protein I6F11_07450 [Ensifer sp. NBAIM29]|nr:hypothetical protein [Ensifer sp. NBAIM29]